MNLAKKDFLQRLPHRPPMLLVDEVLECSERRILARTTFSGQETFFQGHFPHFPVLPGVIACEAAMQCGAILLSQRTAGTLPERIPVVTRLNQVKFKQLVRPGDTLELEVQFKEQLAEAFFFDARIRKEGKLAASFDFACTLIRCDESVPTGTRVNFGKGEGDP